MAEKVEQVMQAMVPEFDDLRRKRIFDEAEIRHIVKRRRDFEYSFQKSTAGPQDYLRGIRYEIALESLRKGRSDALHWKKRTVSDYSGVHRMHFLFERATKRYKGDMRLWFQYIDFCLRSGSTRILSKVLLRCVKLHPKEVNVWLLAADRSLKCGQVKAARTLLLRALRFSPRNAKLWGEFFRLEVQAARNVELAGKAPEDGTAIGPWAPAALLMKRASGRLKENPTSCAALLSTAVAVIEAVRKELEADTEAADGFKIPAGLKELEKQIHEVVVELRPDASATSAPAAAARQLWQIWWDRERGALNSSWHDVAQQVAAAAPPAALQHLAATLARACASGAAASDAAADDALRALLDFAKTPRVVEDSGTTLAVLEALEFCPGQDAVALRLLRRGAKAHPSCFRLRLLASQLLPVDECPLDANDASQLRDGAVGIDGESVKGLQAGSAAQLLTVATAPAAGDERLVASLKSLAPGESPGPLLDLFLAEALACGLSEFRTARSQAHKVVASLWEVPRVRVEGLEALLLSELRAVSVEDLRPKHLVARFEEVLSSLDDGEARKIDWWVRFVEFTHRLAKLNKKAEGAPTPMDLHWRAMRSVSDQTLYSEKVHRLLQSGAVS